MKHVSGKTTLRFVLFRCQQGLVWQRQAIVVSESELTAIVLGNRDIGHTYILSNAGLYQRSFEEGGPVSWVHRSDYKILRVFLEYSKDHYKVVEAYTLTSLI